MQNRSAGRQNTIWLLAIAGGVTIMNVFYNQPLLADIARSFQVSVSSVSSIPALTQIGFGVGLLLFVPLGDMVNRQKLIVAKLILVTCALIAAAVSPSHIWLSAASLAIGLTTVVPPIVVPFAAQISAPLERGKAIGTVMSGIFFGILLSRTISGFIGATLGWRAVYWIAAMLMLVLAVVLAKLLPTNKPSSQISYPQLMQSLPQLIQQQSVLREASVTGAMLFGVFNAFWTTLVFLLSRPPYHYGSEVAGLFGLVGISGSAAAPMVGSLADKRGPRLTVGLAIAITVVAYGVFWLWGYQLWGLAVGAILLDLGVQAGMVSNQARIYTLLPETYNSRLNTIYMVSYYLGGALGSTLGAYGWSVWQWKGVCTVGLLMLVIAFAAYFGGRKHHSPRQRVN
jgi:predicted MFS family arabinose efflux permease